MTRPRDCAEIEVEKKYVDWGNRTFWACQDYGSTVSLKPVRTGEYGESGQYGECGEFGEVRTWRVMREKMGEAKRKLESCSNNCNRHTAPKQIYKLFWVSGRSRRIH